MRSGLHGYGTVGQFVPRNIFVTSTLRPLRRGLQSHTGFLNEEAFMNILYMLVTLETFQ